MSFLFVIFFLVLNELRLFRNFFFSPDKVGAQPIEFEDPSSENEDERRAD